MSMGFLKGIFSFLIINISVIIGITLIFYILSLFGLNVSYQSNLLLYSIVLGFFSSIISLLTSKWLIKKTYNILIVGEDIDNDIDLKISYLKTKLDYLNNEYGYNIELGIYEDNNPNAFATGCGVCGYLISFSTGIIELMSKEELDGVLGHEFSHIENKDVITTTILQGFLNTFVIYLSHLIANIIVDDDNEGGFLYFILVMILEFLFGILVSVILAFFSRKREYKADYDSATKYSSKENMINSLKKLKISNETENVISEKKEEYTAALRINNYSSKLLGLFSTHPDLEDRINKLIIL